jgi:arginyl-tRNA synthetase
MTFQSLQQLLAARVRTALESAFAHGHLGQLTAEQLDEFGSVSKIVIQKPKQVDLGDYATPVAMALAKPSRSNPLALAESIASELQSPDYTVEVAKPGFINIRFSEAFLAAQLEQVLILGNDYGRTQADKSEKILLEFVSANPTGPLHVGHGRWAALGSSLANILGFAGYEVDCEFYINDAGNQMQILGESLKVRYLQALGETLELPANAYRGKDIQEIAAELVAEVGESKRDADVAWFSRYAEDKELSRQKAVLAEFRTEFDQWYSERALHAADAVEETFKDFDARGMLYRATQSRQEASGEITHRSTKVRKTPENDENPEGTEAVYFRSADFGDENDRVLRKATGQFTYITPDIAYHRDKYNRGYDRLIDILGADHHGYVPRMRAAIQALGHPGDSFEVLLGQMVRLFKTNPETGEKEEMRMSKRTGDLVSVEDLIEEVGVDAARWFLLSQSLNSTINFDLDLAKSEKFDNPVYYVQYNHARCCSILRKAPERGMPLPEHYAFLKSDGNPWLIETPERTLSLRLIAAPDEIRFAAIDRTPQRLTQYAYELASDMSQFYENCPTLPPLADKVELGLRYARLGLVDATRQVLANILTLLGIEPKTRMERIVVSEEATNRSEC